MVSCSWGSLDLIFIQVLNKCILRKRMDHFFISSFYWLSKDSRFIAILLMYLNDKEYGYFMYSWPLETKTYFYMLCINWEDLWCLISQSLYMTFFFSIWLLKFIDNNKKILRNELLKIDWTKFSKHISTIFYVYVCMCTLKKFYIPWFKKHLKVHKCISIYILNLIMTIKHVFHSQISLSVYI